MLFDERDRGNLRKYRAKEGNELTKFRIFLLAILNNGDFFFYYRMTASVKALEINILIVWKIIFCALNTAQQLGTNSYRIRLKND